MKIIVFQSGKGDCLLLSNRTGKRHVLVDGGMTGQYNKYVANTLGALAEEGKALDLVYLSHIDQDHIAGVLRLMDDLVAWKVHDFQRANGNMAHRAPNVLRPPKVKEIWHNAFGEMVDQNDGDIGDLFATVASILTISTDKQLSALANAHAGLATSVDEGIRLSRRIGANQLGIPLNKYFGGKLGFVREDTAPLKPFKLGTLQFYVIGPFKEALERLRLVWDCWLTKNKARLAEIEKKALDDAERMGTDAIEPLLDIRLAQAKALGDPNSVTPPNVASLMVLVEEDGKQLLLTGDGRAEEILRGLEYHNKLNEAGQIHVNVLKVQHHGALDNMPPDSGFAQMVTADHYIFCGNGTHNNPELKVIETILDARLNGGATYPGAGGNFTFWFNCSESAASTEDNARHMKALQEYLAGVQSGGRLTVYFLEEETPSFEMVI